MNCIGFSKSGDAVVSSEVKTRDGVLSANMPRAARHAERETTCGRMRDRVGL